MNRLGLNNNGAVPTGKTYCGRVTQKIAGGYLVKFGDNRQYTGVVLTAEHLTHGTDLLFTVVGQRDGMALLHTVFGGYR